MTNGGTASGPFPAIKRETASTSNSNIRLPIHWSLRLIGIRCKTVYHYLHVFLLRNMKDIVEWIFVFCIHEMDLNSPFLRYFYSGKFSFSLPLKCYSYTDWNSDQFEYCRYSNEIPSAIYANKTYFAVRSSAMENVRQLREEIEIYFPFIINNSENHLIRMRISVAPRDFHRSWVICLRLKCNFHRRDVHP